jgi:pimeloyl-CoA synthetase
LTIQKLRRRWEIKSNQSLSFVGVQISNIQEQIKELARFIFTTSVEERRKEENRKFDHERSI